MDGYKADLYIKDTDTIVEIKSVISFKICCSISDSLFRERAINQTAYAEAAIGEREKVCFMIVSLHPYVTEIVIDKNTFFYKELSNCVELGMVLYGFTCRLRDRTIVIDNQIPVS